MNVSINHNTHHPHGVITYRHIHNHSPNPPLKFCREQKWRLKTGVTNCGTHQRAKSALHGCHNRMIRTRSWIWLMSISCLFFSAFKPHFLLSACSLPFAIGQSNQTTRKKRKLLHYWVSSIVSLSFLSGSSSTNLTGLILGVFGICAILYNCRQLLMVSTSHKKTCC